MTHVECVEAIWRLQDQLCSEREIIRMMYYRLAKLTGTLKKLDHVPYTSEREFSHYLYKWFHGTVGNYIMPAGKMGAFVREQFLLHIASEERPLTDDEKSRVKFKCTREYIHALLKMQFKDAKLGTKSFDDFVSFFL